MYKLKISSDKTFKLFCSVNFIRVRSDMAISFYCLTHFGNSFFLDKVYMQIFLWHSYC